MTLTLWGLEASPFLLKIEALFNSRGLAFRRLPRDGGRVENMLMAWRLARARRQGRVRRYPRMEALDEYPEVPYLIVDGREIQYDSSAVAHWLDAELAAGAPPFFPADPALAFVASLIDEAFDEFGLYMVHHQRWVCSATDTAMAEVTAGELARLLPPPLASRVRVRVARRQTRRCPYLFSVAPEGYTAAVEPQRVPPARPGFPATHQLLERSWRRYLAAVEELLAGRPYLLGEGFTIADASAYGQLSMNLIDPTTVAELQRLAPRTYRWLQRIRDGGHRDDRGTLVIDSALRPLLGVVMDTFAALMVQNETAYRRAVDQGQTVFNEAAFDQGLALYDGELLGQPFRSVVKTFQVRVWRDLCRQWQALGVAEQAALRELLPRAHLFDGAGDDSTSS
jgi:glutathione S-transferase